jgi:hypothetical protein
MPKLTVRLQIRVASKQRYSSPGILKIKRVRRESQCVACLFDTKSIVVHFLQVRHGGLSIPPVSLYLEVAEPMECEASRTRPTAAKPMSVSVGRILTTSQTKQVGISSVNDVGYSARCRDPSIDPPHTLLGTRPKQLG